MSSTSMDDMKKRVRQEIDTLRVSIADLQEISKRYDRKVEEVIKDTEATNEALFQILGLLTAMTQSNTGVADTPGEFIPPRFDDDEAPLKEDPVQLSNDQTPLRSCHRE